MAACFQARADEDHNDEQELGRRGPRQARLTLLLAGKAGTTHLE